MTLFGALLWAGLRIVKREQSPVLKLIGLGVLSTIGLQALINLAVVTGLGPTKGIALPLVSSGGTGWILTAASLGMLVAMDRALRQSEVDAVASMPEVGFQPESQGVAPQPIPAGALATA